MPLSDFSQLLCAYFHIEFDFVMFPFVFGMLVRPCLSLMLVSSSGDDG